MATAKQILNDLEEYDDYDVVELLEMKYEKFYFEMPKNWSLLIFVMDIRIHNKSGNYVSLEDYIQEMENTIIMLQATVVQLEYATKSHQKEQSDEAPKSDYDKLKEEIIEEVNLIISDLLWHFLNR